MYSIIDHYRCGKRVLTTKDQSTMAICRRRQICIFSKHQTFRLSTVLKGCPVRPHDLASHSQSLMSSPTLSGPHSSLSSSTTPLLLHSTPALLSPSGRTFVLAIECSAFRSLARYGLIRHGQIALYKRCLCALALSSLFISRATLHMMFILRPIKQGTHTERPLCASHHLPLCLRCPF